ncbi:DUF2806 domain-containing protein [Pseudomonas farris]
MSDGFSLIDIKGISEPLTKLIESVSKGIGALYEPTGKVRNAKAEAKASLILAKANAQVDAVSLRALERMNYREIRRQNNIDAIVIGAAEYLPNEVSVQEVDEDWIVNFFDLGQDIGNVEMQKIWSKLLAGEVARPGSFKPRTLQAVKSLTPEEANLFTRLCSFSFLMDDGSRVLPVFSTGFYEFVRVNGFTTDNETHLKDIGLLNNGFIWYGAQEDDPDKVFLDYFSDSYYIVPESSDKRLDVAYTKVFPFTGVGCELASIAGAQPDKEYIKVLCDELAIFPAV